MYIQYCSHKQNGKTYTYPLLCKKYREAGKIKTEVVANLTKFPQDAVLAIAGALKKSKDFMVSLKDIVVTKSIDYGFVFILLALMQRLRITEVLEKIMGERANLVRLMIIGKIVTRGSKLCIFNWITRNDAIAKKLGIDLSVLKVGTLYEALGDLSYLQNKIERKWNIYHKSEKNEIYLYDITSSYFEGTENALAAFGYNRDGKNGKMQIVIGLITNNEGFPLSIEVFDGNESDDTTVIKQLQKIKNEYGVSNVIFVGDRGMRIRYNLEQMEEEESLGIKYITALSIEEIRCLIKEDVLQLSLFSKDLAEIENDGVRYVLCTNPDLEREHSQLRAELKSKFEEKLHEIKLSYDTRQHKNNQNKIRISHDDKNKKLVTQFSEKQIDSYKYRVRKALEKTNMQSFFQIMISEEKFIVEFDFEKYTQARQLDGKYVIVTNVSKETMIKETVRQEYKNLKFVEHAFRDMKTSQLDVRPIFHINENTTRGHVFVTMFAYAIVRELENRIFPWLKENNKNKKTQLSLQDIEEELKMIKLNVLEINNHHEEIKITELTTRQKEIFRELDIKPELLLA
ncbi:MAG: IS1634 family transposase [Bacteroidetes bacterium]|nr:IS1634 family transposase [Bacteroidota bacterium]